jgi:hypothetical protein
MVSSIHWLDMNEFNIGYIIMVMLNSAFGALVKHIQKKNKKVKFYITTLAFFITLIY